MEPSDLHPNNRLRQERLRHNWRQREVADRVGTTVVTVNRWERGNQQPGAYFRVKLCALFGMTAEELGICAEDPQPSGEGETEAYASVEQFNPSMDAAGQVEDASVLPCADLPDECVAAIPSSALSWSAHVLAQKGQNRIRMLRMLEWLEARPWRAYNWPDILPTVVLLSIVVSVVWIICRH